MRPCFRVKTPATFWQFARLDWAIAHLSLELTEETQNLFCTMLCWLGRSLSLLFKVRLLSIGSCSRSWGKGNRPLHYSKGDRPPFAWADRRNPIPFWCFALVVWAIALSIVQSAIALDRVVSVAGTGGKSDRPLHCSKGDRSRQGSVLGLGEGRSPSTHFHCSKCDHSPIAWVDEGNSTTFLHDALLAWAIAS